MSVKSSELRRRLTLAATLAGMALFLGACGGDSSSSGRPPLTVAPPNPVAVAAACVASGAMAVNVNSTTGDVSIYFPKGNWDSSTTGIYLTPIEGGGVGRATIATPKAVNSCSANSATGTIVCSANNHDVYFIKGTSLTGAVTSAASGSVGFTGGSCTNCNAMADPVLNIGIIGMSLSSGSRAGFQSFDLGSGAGGPIVQAPGNASSVGTISESPAIEPNRHWLLSATELNDYQIIDYSSGSPVVYRYADRSKIFTDDELDGSAIDCTTDIALASDEFTGNLFIADLKQAVFTPGSPGSWTAPAQLQNMPELNFPSAGTTGLAIAPSGHVGILEDEFGGADFGAIRLPATSGSGTPAVKDWVSAQMPNDPAGNPWEMTLDPHGLTAYTSPATGKPMGIIGEFSRAYVAVIDINKLLAAPRSPAHVVDPTYDLVANHVVRFVKVH
jgi:hypothetical protein